MTNKSLIAICLSIILGFTMLSASVYYGFKAYSTGLKTNSLRYEMISNGDNIFVFDRITGTYWQKFVASNEGPNDWIKEAVPTE